jgi:dihydrodipicolinate synthase/N-acetylneuraminate lyase
MPRTILPRPIKGIIPPVLTPLADRDQLDAGAFDRLLNYLIEGGSTALFVLGSTGESPGLSHRLRREVIDRACAAIGGRVPLLVGITDTAFEESLRLAEHAARVGASALVLSPPYYFNLSQQAFLGYLERLVPLLPLPVYLYNIPSLTKLNITPETVRAASRLPNIYGLKDSSGSVEYFDAVQSLMADRPDFAILGGVEEILAEMVARGAHGGVCGGANLYPRLYVDLFDAAECGDAERVRSLQKTVMIISEGVYRAGEPESSYLRGLKCAAAMLGFGNGLMAEPYFALRQDEREGIRAALEAVGLLTLTVAP